jgi:hypothetical protein
VALTGELRQGELAGIMVDAVAKAAGVPGALVRRALMLSGDLTRMAEVALARARRASPHRLRAVPADGAGSARMRSGPGTTAPGCSSATAPSAARPWSRSTSTVVARGQAPAHGEYVTSADERPSIRARARKHETLPTAPGRGQRSSASTTLERALLPGGLGTSSARSCSIVASRGRGSSRSACSSSTS